MHTFVNRFSVRLISAETYMMGIRKISLVICAFIITVALAVNMTACGKGKKIPGLERFHVGVVQKHLYASFVSTTLTWDYGITVPIPGLDDAIASAAPDLQSAGTIFQFSINLESLLNNGKPFPESGLPDGRPIPDVQGGKLPRWDAEIGKLPINLYLSNEAFGLFVPLVLKNKKGIQLPGIVSMKIEDDRGNLLGKVYAVPPMANGLGSGVFILLPYLGGSTPKSD